MNRTLYTFIIPHKNLPDLLQRCVNSIPRREDVQIIVADDDSDPKIVDWDTFRFEDGRGIELYLTKGCKSAGAVRNEGLKHARGKWVLFADCDDYYNPGLLDVLDQYRNSDCDALFFDVDCKDGTTGEPSDFFQEYQQQVEAYANDRSMLEKIRYVMTPWPKMVKRSLIDLYEIQFEDVILGNDIWYSYQVGYLSKKVDVIPHRLYVYTLNAGSITHHRSVAKDVTQIETFVKRDEFFEFIHHPEWDFNIFKMLKYYWMKSDHKTRYSLALLGDVWGMYKIRNRYVNGIMEKVKLGEEKALRER